MKPSPKFKIGNICKLKNLRFNFIYLVKIKEIDNKTFNGIRGNYGCAGRKPKNKDDVGFFPFSEYKVLNYKVK